MEHHGRRHEMKYEATITKGASAVSAEEGARCPGSRSEARDSFTVLRTELPTDTVKADY